MATLEEPELVEHTLADMVSDTQAVMQRALGHELSEEEATKLGFDLLEFLDAFTGGDNDSRESC